MLMLEIRSLIEHSDFGYDCLLSFDYDEVSGLCLTE
jgi:hypothetical protein